MKINGIQQVIKIVLLVFVLVVVQKNVMFLNEHYKTVSVRLEKDGITMERIQEINRSMAEMEDTAIKEIVPWKVEKNSIVVNPILKKECRVASIGVYGSMQATIPMDLAAGNYVYKQDQNGCLIDKSTAYKLFGTIDIIGNEVRIEKKSYFIRGVVETQQMVLLFQSKNKRDIFYNIEIVFSREDWEEGLQRVKSLLYQYNIGDDAVFLDGAIYANTIKHYEAIPYWILYITMVIMMVLYLKYYIRKRHSKRVVMWEQKKEIISKRNCFIVVFFIVVAIGLGIMLSYYFENPCYLPQQWTPTKWSDFDFWVKMAQDIKEEFIRIRYTMPNVKDVVLIQKLEESLFGIIIASILIIHIMYHLYEARKHRVYGAAQTS